MLPASMPRASRNTIKCKATCSLKTSFPASSWKPSDAAGLTDVASLLRAALPDRQSRPPARMLQVILIRSTSVMPYLKLFNLFRSIHKYHQPHINQWLFPSFICLLRGSTLKQSWDAALSTKDLVMWSPFFSNIYPTF